MQKSILKLHKFYYLGEKSEVFINTIMCGVS